MLRLTHSCFSIVLLFGLGGYMPQTWSAEVIGTDRPDFVESSNVVGAHHVQIETSVAFESDRQSNVKTRIWSTPTLLRLGLSDAIEVRFETDGFLSQHAHEQHASDTRSSGYAEYSLGMKWHQDDAEEKAGAPSVGWLLHFDMPSGSKPFHSQRIRPSIRMVAEWELARGYSFGVMPGLVWDVNESNDRYFGGILGAVLGKSFSEQLRGFVEFGGQLIKRKADGGSQLTLDVGMAYLLNDVTQLDMAYTHALNQYTPDHMLGIGLSMKF